MLLDRLVAAVVRSVFYQLPLVCQFQPFLGKDLAIATHALVTSMLDYCNALYVELRWEITQKSQLVQNVAGRTVC